MKEQRKYDATYNFGNSTVHIVSPSPITKEEQALIIREMHMAGWVIIKKLIQKGQKV